MTHHLACPRCLQEIAASRRQQSPTVCDSCGYVATGSEDTVHEKLEKRFLKTIIAFSTIAVVSFVQVATWGNHAVEATFLQASDLTGTSSRNSQERLASICYELKKWDCVEKLYGKLASSGKPEDLYRYSQLLMSRAKYGPAGETYKRYFAAGGKEMEARYLYARALAETGHIDEAAKHFDIVLRAKPGILQVTVVTNYVKYLVKANRLDHAKKVIHRIRSQGETVSQFMDSELKEISARLATSRS